MRNPSLVAAGIIFSALAVGATSPAHAGSRLSLDDSIPGGSDAYYEPSNQPKEYLDPAVVHSPRTSSCNRARHSVTQQGYEAVRKIECRGRHYTFHGRRDGQWWKIKVRARNGRVRQAYPLRAKILH